MTMKLITGLKTLLFGTLSYFIISCNNPATDVTMSMQKASLGSININNPSAENSGDRPRQDGPDIIKTWEMPEALMEISGLSFIDKNRIACIQDEEGIVFVYNLSNSSVESQTQFEKGGDFEDIAIIGNTAWVVRSDGRLFEIENFTAKDAMAKEYETSLSAHENVEGLCYDQKNNRLLLSVKDRDDHGKNVKGIYAYDPVKKFFDNDPVYQLHTDDDILGSHKSKNNIRPSAITINPLSGNIYILDGPSARLLILGTDNKGKKLIEFDHKKFRQPEGITFSPDGKMYISNEGYKKTPGNILEVNLN